MWNTVELYGFSLEGGGLKYLRINLVKVLVDYFQDEVVLLYSPGLPSVLVFKNYCHFALQSTDDGDGKNLRIAAAAIKM